MLFKYIIFNYYISLSESEHRRMMRLISNEEYYLNLMKTSSNPLSKSFNKIDIELLEDSINLINNLLNNDNAIELIQQNVIDNINTQETLTLLKSYDKEFQLLKNLFEEEVIVSKFNAETWITSIIDKLKLSKSILTSVFNVNQLRALLIIMVYIKRPNSVSDVFITIYNHSKFEAIEFILSNKLTLLLVNNEDKLYIDCKLNFSGILYDELDCMRRLNVFKKK